MKFISAILCLVALSPRAHAVMPVFDLNVFYFSDTMVYSSANSTYGRTFYDLMIGLPLSKQGRWVIGWNYDSYSFKDNPGVATTLTVSGMGPKIFYAIDKDQTFIFAFTYNLITKGTYTPGSTASSELRGTSMRAELSYQPKIGESSFLGPKLNWYKASFAEEITGQTALAKVTHSRTVIYPSLAFTYRF